VSFPGVDAAVVSLKVCRTVPSARWNEKREVIEKVIVDARRRAAARPRIELALKSVGNKAKRSKTEFRGVPEYTIGESACQLRVAMPRIDIREDSTTSSVDSLR